MFDVVCNCWRKEVFILFLMIINCRKTSYVYNKQTDRKSNLKVDICRDLGTS